MGEERAGLANPYALAELAIGRRVDWKSITDRDAFVAKTFGVSVEEMLTPVEGNPLVTGMAASQDILSDVRTAKTKRSATFASKVKQGPVSTMLSKLSPAAQARIIAALSGGNPGDNQEHTPPGAVWADPGSFFGEATEFFDPVQGGLGDCYFISALSAVAWARSYSIMQRTRATGPANDAFVDRIDFYSGGNPVSIEVTELLAIRAFELGRRLRHSGGNVQEVLLAIRLGELSPYNSDPERRGKLALPLPDFSDRLSVISEL